MPRKRKRVRAAQRAEEAKLAPPPAIGTALGVVLKQAGVTLQPRKVEPKAGTRTPVPHVPEPAVRFEPAPRAASKPGGGLTTTELRMLNDAYEGARPLDRKNARAKPVAEREVAARNPVREAQLHAEVRSEEFAARSRLAALV